MTDDTPHDDGRADDRSRGRNASRRTFLRTAAVAGAAGLGIGGGLVGAGSAQTDGTETLTVLDFEGSSVPSENSLGNWTGATDFAAVDVVDGALRLEYDGAGQLGTVVRRDVSAYDRLELVVRGDSGGEESDVQLEVGDLQGSLAELASDTAEVKIGTSFSTVAVDLGPVGDTVDDVWLNFWQGGSGAIEIDEIRFAGGSNTGGPEEQTVSADLSVEQVSPDGTAEASITLSGAPEGVSGYDMTVSVSDTSVATIEDATYPDWAFQQGKEIAADGSSATLQAVDANEQIQSDAGEVELATVTLQAQSTGEADVGVSVAELDADGGSDIPATTTAGTLTVADASVEPIGEAMPTDPDGDGLYEDLNGNGELDSDDVVVYFNNYDQSVVTDHTDAYDYNGNGEIDFDDVVQLFDEL